MLPLEGDPFGYNLSLEDQRNSFVALKDVVGLLACLRIQADIDEGLEQRYTGVLASVKEQSPGVDLSALEAALADDPDAVRREAVRRLLEGSEGSEKAT